MADGVKIGFLNDMAAAGPAPGDDMIAWIEREIAAVRKAGRFDGDVEIVRGYGLGLPSGTGEAVERAFAELVAADVALIVGPAIGDNALHITPFVERAGVPTINWAGAERARGEWMFHLQVGSHEDESLVIARHLAALGKRRLGVVHDRSPIGTRHLQFLIEEARVIGSAIVAAEAISPLDERAGSAVGSVLAARPDAIVYLGLGLSAPAVARALVAEGWRGPRMMNTAGIRGYHGDFAQICNEWTYIDMHSDGNHVLARVIAEEELGRDKALAVAKGHDLGRLVAEAVARAPSLTRAGLREGLEKVKWLPAAEGNEGTLLGFGIQDRGALHGRYLVVRQWLHGQSIEVRPPEVA
jgi:branched-chain amino acid transport system substrate-binding protein